ncbi:hypothetical protein HDA32_002600 [Spinactinospora alkalitolerans]|uniref:DUF3817 domain-containing protein n=1 Tax=Spinactinospora alkalitolerans TaxID=687207 RepID=A0A852U0D5_9ACTN|nr:DUF3817 domain-containing protein [Spinactinospora alkalitolerans]NYE47480.1 hypothetical protein [Spinactinospora alkalitolerans]
MPRDLPFLRLASAAEALSLVVLLGNLLTVHWAPVSSIIGPVHGCAYLMVVAATWLVPGASVGARIRAWVPGVGGLLATRALVRDRGPRSAEAGADR